jgi:hypothetical protein
VKKSEQLWKKYRHERDDEKARQLRNAAEEAEDEEGAPDIPMGFTDNGRSVNFFKRLETLEPERCSWLKRTAIGKNGWLINWKD